METNSDKNLRDKLMSNEFPFDPNAWAQMEALLDEKKKRRGFFWWWTGGIAATLLLLVGSIGWGLYLMKEDDGLTDKKTTYSSNVVVSETQQTNIHEQQKTNKQLTLAEEKSGKMAPFANINLKGAKHNKSTAQIRTHQHHQRSNAIGKKMNEQLLLSRQHKETDQAICQVLREENPFTHEIEKRNTTAQKRFDENILMKRAEASLLNSLLENDEIDFNKKENEDLLPKKKKKQIFNYSLGVLANVSGTTLGSQIISVNQRNRPSSFYSQPSYMVGFTHDFLFINRVAITNSILYSQTSFKVYSPKTVTFSKTPSEYTSHISELTIPIGVKIYAVAKNNFRFYINTGIINHIKLKETFDYNMPMDTVAPNSLGVANVADVNFNPPTETFFSRNKSVTENLNTNDFSINQAKRYYASFYASAGFEFVAKKHFILFTEPMFYMSLQKIGVQEKRKYNLGLNGGFRYQF